eukprot:m.232573 g.232573  ORF g.232573 m.232573 type:complete len:162 (+) comp12378_c0_seq1:36-521(+)
MQNDNNFEAINNAKFTQLVTRSAMASSTPTKTVKNEVHQNAILAETVRKELATQQIFDTYSVNKKNLVCLTGKPNVAYDQTLPETSDSLSATQATKPKAPLPRTTAGDYGWYNDKATGDMSEEFYKGRKQTEITDYMDAYWRQKEQATLGGKTAAAPKEKA